MFDARADPLAFIKNTVVVGDVPFCMSFVLKENFSRKGHPDCRRYFLFLKIVQSLLQPQDYFHLIPSLTLLLCMCKLNLVTGVVNLCLYWTASVCC